MFVRKRWKDEELGDLGVVFRGDDEEETVAALRKGHLAPHSAVGSTALHIASPRRHHNSAHLYNNNSNNSFICR